MLRGLTCIPCLNGRVCFPRVMRTEFRAQWPSFHVKLRTDPSSMSAQLVHCTTPRQGRRFSDRLQCNLQKFANLPRMQLAETIGHSFTGIPKGLS